MRARSLCIAMAGAAILCSGCGTIRNLSPDGMPSVYGGVRDDCERIAKCAIPPTRQQILFANAGIVLLILDLPFAAIGDTITLPYTFFWAEVTRSINDFYFPRDSARRMSDPP